MSFDTQSALRFEDVTYRYPAAEKAALRDLSLDLPAGKQIVLLGHNGSGKSTLMLHANGILRPESGTVHFMGTPIDYAHKALRLLRQQVGVVFQNADDQIFSASVRQDIAFGPLNLGLSETETRQRVDEVAEECGIASLLDRPAHSLSGGEKARVALAGVLAMRPQVLLVDEPTASLDPPARERIFQIFSTLNRRGTTVILSTHEVEIARHWAEYVVILQQGRMLSAETVERTFANQDLLREAGLDRPWYAALRRPNVHT